MLTALSVPFTFTRSTR